MAAVDQRKSILVVMEDKNQGYLVFNITIKDLFQSRPRPVPLSRSPAAQMEMRSLPSPMGQIPRLVDHPESIDFALAGDGATIVGVSNYRRTVTYDTRSGASSTGPELQHGMSGGTYVVPLGHRIYALKCRLSGYDEERPTGESCDLLLPSAAAGARLRRVCSSSSWRDLPEPPPDFRCLSSFQPTCQLTTYFTAGTRLWVSAEERGTYSLDTVRGEWRKEGDWELPFFYRALFVPELDNLCFGLCSKRRCLLAVDVRQSPPVVRYRWKETFPRWIHDNDTGNICCLAPEGSLVYLGGGKFCIAWTVGMHDADDYWLKRNLIHVMAVQVIKTSTSSGKKELRMVKHKVCCYKMPSHGQMAYAL